MDTPSAGTAAESVAEKLTGVLERLVDARMLVLGLSFLIYLDIWLIKTGVDPFQIKVDAGVVMMKSLTPGDLAVFFLSYSLLMSAAIPAMRHIYVVLMTHYGPHISGSRAKPDQARQFSNWSMGLVLFSAGDASTGYLRDDGYQGAVRYFLTQLPDDGFAVSVLRCSAILFMVVCLLTAFEYDC